MERQVSVARRRWRPEEGGSVALALDLLVAGVHFPMETPPRALGHKALAVNLSDLAAMGAPPRYALAHVSHPGEPPAGWEDEFIAGLDALAARFGVRVEHLPARRHCGGALFIAVEAAGSFPADDPRPLLRSGARPGDSIYVTGTLGDAAAALGGASSLTHRLEYPEPRVAAGLALRHIATSAIDISDGLCADLGHLLGASGVGATIHAAHIPLSSELVAAHGRERALDFALSGGDDYELAFTVAAGDEARLADAKLGVAVTRIGVIEAAPGLRCLGPDGAPRPVPTGYAHFERDADGKPRAGESVAT